MPYFKNIFRLSEVKHPVSATTETLSLSCTNERFLRNRGKCVLSAAVGLPQVYGVELSMS